ncbi:Leucine-rich repeat-containing protein 57 [Schistosoma haematobium]|uniref:Leucine-rich repeat-containing protein 57 n=1 Tax=Schistosoma haematobium TaxID=6185 RepID=A0A095ALH8_SCHHA|nr:Leucine-rich repeat-containing protein 57 [Schistosoma haematobium]KAH9581444.1 Leucine-rich repeat-containing protein 57 [Schistosoma haematobium]CAH8619897.1 unnamed protein product [Schistosoma haematobium]CAH8627808.1 unnamed protein product [Schistosoma haematobium]
MGNTIAPRIENAEKTGVLQVSGLKLKKVPEQVKHLRNLRSLDLSNNKIENIDPWISLLKNLKVLNVENNKLKCFPAEIYLLTKLESLNGNSNFLINFITPGAIVNLNELSCLRTVNLSHNCLTEFPVELCLKSIPINVIDLSNNQISIIPNAIASLQAIEINLNSNKISIISNGIAQCERLKVLRLEHNCLRLENFPTELLTNSQVSLICVDGNSFNMKDFYNLPGYSKYMERFTAMKKKAA